MPDCDNITSVEYREIHRFPGYRFGGDGSVWSRWTHGKRGEGNGRGNGPAVIGDSWRLVAGYCRKRSGYRTVELKEVGRSKPTNYLVHRLILEAFTGPCPEGMECCHGKEGRSVNAVRNLRWDTHANNIGDRDRDGNTVKGERNNKAKLREQDIPEIFRLTRAGWTKEQIGSIFGVGRKTVSNVLLRKVWQHVPV